MKSLFAIALLAVAPPLAAQMTATPVPPVAKAMKGPYVQMAGSSDLYEKQSSQLVLESAANPDVRRFAEMMVTDHANTTAQLLAAAKESNIYHSPKIQTKHAQMLRSLRRLPKDQRERGYVDQQVMAHEEALALHSGYASGGDNPRLQAVAAAAVPIIQAHLDEIRRIQGTMGGAATR
jgi:putative membrane protein